MKLEKYITQQELVDAFRWFGNFKIFDELGIEYREGVEEVEILTISGWSKIEKGDYVIKEMGIDFYYPIKQKVFERKYKKIELRDNDLI